MGESAEDDTSTGVAARFGWTDDRARRALVMRSTTARTLAHAHAAPLYGSVELCIFVEAMAVLLAPSVLVILRLDNDRPSGAWFALVWFWLGALLLLRQLLLLRLPQDVHRVPDEYVASWMKRRTYVVLLAGSLAIAAIARVIGALSGTQTWWQIDSTNVGAVGTVLGVAMVYDLAGRDQDKWREAIAFAANSRVLAYEALPDEDKKNLPRQEVRHSIPRVNGILGPGIWGMLSLLLAMLMPLGNRPSPHNNQDSSLSAGNWVTLGMVGLLSLVALMCWIWPNSKLRLFRSVEAIADRLNTRRAVFYAPAFGAALVVLLAILQSL